MSVFLETFFFPDTRDTNEQNDIQDGGSEGGARWPPLAHGLQENIVFFLNRKRE